MLLSVGFVTRNNEGYLLTYLSLTGSQASLGVKPAQPKPMQRGSNIKETSKEGSVQRGVPSKEGSVQRGVRPKRGPSKEGSVQRGVRPKEGSIQRGVRPSKEESVQRGVKEGSIQRGVHPKRGPSEEGPSLRTKGPKRGPSLRKRDLSQAKVG